MTPTPAPPPKSRRARRAISATLAWLRQSPRQLANLMSRGTRRLVRAVLGRALAFPASAALLILVTVLALSLRVRASLLVALIAYVVMTGATVGILRRSLRDPLNLNPLVKSLRLRRRVRKRWAHAMRNAKLEVTARGRGEPSRPRRTRVRLTPVGVTTRVRLASVGVTGETLAGRTPSICVSVGAREARVREIGPSVARLDLRHTNPLTRKITSADLPASTRRGFVVVGLDEDGDGLEKELRLPSLVVGAQGSGKSTEVWRTIWALKRAGIPFRLRVFDPKGGQEFTDLADVAYQYERNPIRWPAFLGQALGGLVKRQQDLASRGIRNFGPGQYTEAEPLDLMIIDELVTVAAFKTDDVQYTDGDGRHTLPADRALMLYLSQARSAGYSMLALSQLGQKTVLGPHIVDLFGYRTCLRVGSDELVDVVLGSGRSKAYPAHLLPPGEEYAGIGYVNTHGPKGLVQYRAAPLTEFERIGLIRSLRAERRSRKAAGIEQEPPELEVVGGAAPRRGRGRRRS